MLKIKANKERIERLLADPKTESDWFGSGTYYADGVVFDDGYMMDVKICGVISYEEGGCNTPWTEAILFDPYGMEVACTDAEEEYFGTWKINYNGKDYIISVEEG